jgi:carboxypeptidase PM20D1
VKRASAFAAVGVLALVALLLWNAVRLESVQPHVPAPAPLRVDAEGVASRLAQVIRYRTISHEDRGRLDADAFRRLHRALERSYPRVHASLRRERVAELSLLYTWPGRDPSLRPVLFAAHLDVVPVDAGSAEEWTHPPFDGVVEDGLVWGRGAIDDKASVVCLLEALELLLATGYRPERTVHLAFGHDEEVGGDDGARAMAGLLGERGVQLEWVLDEGGVITRDFVPGIADPVAVIGVAEKGSVSIDLEVAGAGGHSSVPPRRTAIGELARAVATLVDEPMPAHVDGVTALFLDHLTPELPLALRLVLANRWLFAPLVVRGFERVPALDAMLRTTIAPTLLEAGVKENVLPVRARALVNFRIHPRDDVDGVVEHVRRVLDERVRLRVGARTTPREPSPVSPVDSDAYRVLRRSIREVFPGVAVVPYLMLGGSDARHYQGLTRSVHRFGPYVFGREALKLTHGTDERIRVSELVGAVRFYVRLVRNTAGGESPASP